MASAEREPITGVWGQSPQRGPAAEPLVGVRGAKPPEAERVLAVGRPKYFNSSTSVTIVCAGLNESASARQVFFTGGGDRRRQRTENTRFSTKFKVTQSCEAMT